MEWEQYERSVETDGKSVTINVRMKWSAWSADPGVWEWEAPGALKHMREMLDNHLRLEMSSREEIRYGTVDIYGTSECDGVDGDLTATGYFDEYWDSVSDLMDTLGIKTTDDTYDTERSLLLECLPFVSIGGDPGVRREFSVRANSVDRLLVLVDNEEECLVDESIRLWRELVGIYERRGGKK